MNMAKLDRRGRVSIPKAVLKRIGIDGAALLLVETTGDGAIILRQAAVYPIEIYNDARIKDFLDEDRLTSKDAGRIISASSLQVWER